MSRLETNEQIVCHLSNNDSNFASLINACGYIEVSLSSDYFSSLAFSIIGQQLSNKVASVIEARFRGLLNDKITPQNIISVNDEKFRQVGISYSKIKYIRNLSEACISDKLKFEDFESLNDEGIINLLSSVKGIGQWTSEMFLIFSLGRPDVYSLGDTGLKRAIKSLYELKEVPSQEELINISKKWAPYRTFASLYLWEGLDKKYIN